MIHSHCTNILRHHVKLVILFLISFKLHTFPKLLIDQQINDISAKLNLITIISSAASSDINNTNPSSMWVKFVTF